MRQCPAAVCTPPAAAASGVQALLLGLLLAPALAVAQAVAIDCDLTGPKGRHYGYSFDYVPSTDSLVLVGGAGHLCSRAHAGASAAMPEGAQFRMPGSGRPWRGQ